MLLKRSGIDSCAIKKVRQLSMRASSVPRAVTIVGESDGAGTASGYTSCFAVVSFH